MPKFVIGRIPTGKKIYPISDEAVEEGLKEGHLKKVNSQVYAETDEGFGKAQTYSTRDMTAQPKEAEAAPKKKAAKKKAAKKTKG